MSNEIEAFQDPGEAVHAPRAADVDPRSEKRDEQHVSALFG